MFNEWITQKYIQWRGNAFGREKTISDFAEYIGVSQSLMSRWMKPGGNVPSSQDAISKLFDKYKIEIYDILGIQLNDAERNRLEFNELIAQLTPENRAKFRKWMLDEIEAQNKAASPANPKKAHGLT